MNFSNEKRKRIGQTNLNKSKSVPKQFTSKNCEFQVFQLKGALKSSRKVKTKFGLFTEEALLKTLL